MIPNHIIHLMHLLSPCKIVGGAVRDLLLQRKAKDYDLATSLIPEKVQEILTQNHIDFQSQAKNMGIITTLDKVDIATLRQDIFHDGSHTKVKFTTSWQEDSNRRDFTINALYMDTEGKIDDFHQGIADLKNHIVRFIGNPEERIRQDYLRALRYIRYYYDYGPSNDQAIDRQMIHIMQRNSACLKGVSKKRLLKERQKIYESPKTKEIEQELKKLGLNLDAL